MDYRAVSCHRNILGGQDNPTNRVRGWVRRYQTAQGFCSLIEQLSMRDGEVINAVHSVFLSTGGSCRP